MKIVFIFLIIVGLLLVVLALKYLLNSSKICYFDLKNEVVEFNIETPGFYSVSLLDAGSIKLGLKTGYKISKKDDENKRIKTKSIERICSDGLSNSVQFIDFEIKNKGNYNLHIRGWENITSKTFGLISTAGIRHTKSPDNYVFLISESKNFFKTTASIIALVLGPLLVVFNFILLYNS